MPGAVTDIEPMAAHGEHVAARPARPRASQAGLVWTLVRTDFKARYHGTLSGFVWALLKPPAMFVVLEAVFSFIFSTDAHYRSNLLIGLFLWDFFAEGTKTGMISLHARGLPAHQGEVPVVDPGGDVALERADHARRVRGGDPDVPGVLGTRRRRWPRRSSSSATSAAAARRRRDLPWRRASCSSGTAI